MHKHITKNHVKQGIILAVITTVIWAGNFVIARGVIHKIPPVGLSFYRWTAATIFMLPIAYHQTKKDFPLFKKHLAYLVVTALTGIALFNTCVYLAAHYTSAINLALIGTTSSPVFVIIMAAIFLHEKITWNRITGLLLCLAGILTLIAQGSIQKLINFHFSKGDIWVLAGAFFFAVYNIMVRKKPAAMHPYSFLLVIFFLGSVMLLPAFIVEAMNSKAVVWDKEVTGSILYLSLGTSVIAFIMWNKAIHCIGAARTALFGNLIPVFSSIEAVLLLNEEFNRVHVISSVFVFAGLIIANLQFKNKQV